MRKEVCLFLIILIVSLPIAEAFSIPVLKEYNNQATCLQEISIDVKDVKLSQDKFIILIESKSNTIINSFIIRLDNKIYYTDKGLLPYNTQYFSIPYSESKQLRVMPRTMYNNKYCNHVMSEEIVNIENLVQETTVQDLNEPLQVKKTTYIGAGDVIAEKNEITQEIKYYHKDNLGSTRVITNQLGNIVYTQNYLPFGEQLQESQDYNAYTGKKLDSETNLYYYGARYYNAKTGRFTTIDPMADLNSPYRYVDNNPLRYVDPTGERAMMLPIGANPKAGEFAKGFLLNSFPPTAIAYAIYRGFGYPAVSFESGRFSIYKTVPPEYSPEFSAGMTAGSIVSLLSGFYSFAGGMAGGSSMPALQVSGGGTIPAGTIGAGTLEGGASLISGASGIVRAFSLSNPGSSYSPEDRLYLKGLALTHGKPKNIAIVSEEEMNIALKNIDDIEYAEFNIPKGDVYVHKFVYRGIKYKTTGGKVPFKNIDTRGLGSIRGYGDDLNGVFESIMAGDEKVRVESLFPKPNKEIIDKKLN